MRLHLRREAAERMNDVALNETDLAALVAAYRSGLPPLEKARWIVAHRARHDVSRQELARQTGISPGQLHHYESLLTLAPELIRAMESGKLTFKEGRALADIRDHLRQIEIAQAFLDGWLSSIFVERTVRIAKARPSASAAQVYDLALSNVPVKCRPKLPPPLRLFRPLPTEINCAIANLAAMFTMVQINPYSEVESLSIRTHCRVLVDRMIAAGLYQGGVKDRGDGIR